jgi:DHA1 family multidrug resistance protein-like MFS transporter
MADIFSSSQQPYVIGIWAFGGIAGPIIGPIIGGFAAQAESWRWPILELLWISGFSLAFLGLLLPETHGPTILLRRAKRLRALTGNHELRTATNEIDGGKLVYDALVLPLVLSIEPVLLFANIYLGFICECSSIVEIALLT